MVACWLLWTGAYPMRVRLTFSLLAVGAWLVGAALLRERVVRPLQTISNLLAALREGDYSIRARGAGSDDALGLALLEVNALSETLRGQRLRELEATALLRRVIEEIDVAVFAFDGNRRLRLVNRGGERLLGQPAERLLGRQAEAVGLGQVERCGHNAILASRPARWTPPSPAARAAGRCGAASSARTASRTSSSSSPT